MIPQSRKSLQLPYNQSTEENFLERSYHPQNTDFTEMGMFHLQGDNPLKVQLNIQTDILGHNSGSSILPERGQCEAFKQNRRGMAERGAR